MSNTNRQESSDQSVSDASRDRVSSFPTLNGKSSPEADFDDFPTAGQFVNNPPTAGQFVNNPPTAGQIVNNPPTAGQFVSGPPTAGQFVSNPPTAGQFVNNPPTGGQFQFGVPQLGSHPFYGPYLNPVVATGPLQAPMTGPFVNPYAGLYMNPLAGHLVNPYIGPVANQQPVGDGSLYTGNADGDEALTQKSARRSQRSDPVPFRQRKAPSGRRSQQEPPAKTPENCSSAGPARQSTLTRQPRSRAGITENDRDDSDRSRSGKLHRSLPRQRSRDKDESEEDYGGSDANDDALFGRRPARRTDRRDGEREGGAAGALLGQIGGSLLSEALGGGQQNSGDSLIGWLGNSLLRRVTGGAVDADAEPRLNGAGAGAQASQVTGGEGQGSTLLGQLGSLFSGGRSQGGGGDDARGDEKGQSPGQEAATHQLLIIPIACSAVQGIRRAAAAESIAVKAFWILMVLISIGLFIRGTMSLSGRMLQVRVERSFQLGKVPFQFPDLYFCPRNSYSGSFPYSLSKQQAETINQEVERLSKLFDEQFPRSGFDPSSKTKVWLIQQSLPSHILKEFIMQKPLQSLFYTPLISNYDDAKYEVVYLPGNVMCFKIVLSERERSVLVRRHNLEDLRLAMFTDPYSADFNYSGAAIRPIVNPNTGESIEFHRWYPNGIINMMGTGYTMLIVPTGVYPSMEHETKFMLAPGKSYDIQIQMEENKFSDELWGTHCSPDKKIVSFVNHLSGERADYNYSYDACFFSTFASNLHKVGGYIQQGFPVAWELRGTPRWGNLSENHRINRSTEEYGSDLSSAWTMDDPVKRCMRQQPCLQQKYSASFSFHNWPSMGGTFGPAFGHANNAAEQPAVYRLSQIAQQLDSGNFTPEMKRAFHQFVSDTMLEVRIRSESPVAPRVLMTASYSSTSFLSDLGGLMGLYLGCSLLTLFEVLELIYGKLSQVFQSRQLNSRRRKPGQPGANVDDAEAAVELRAHGRIEEKSCSGDARETPA